MCGFGKWWASRLAYITGEGWVGQHTSHLLCLIMSCTRGAVVVQCDCVT